MQTFRAIVQGKVQGVFFRAWTKDQALCLGLKGWVRNLPDGSVETLAQGNDDAVARFRELLHEGPPVSRVQTVEGKYEEPEEAYERFEVRY